MIRGVESILLSSANSKKLAAFYRDIVGLHMEMEAEIGEKGEHLYEFAMKSGSALYIMDHSKVKGKNKTPERLMLNFEVDDIKKEVRRIEKNGAKKVQDVYHVEGYGYIATFKDLDGNFFQLVQIRATN